MRCNSTAQPCITLAWCLSGEVNLRFRLRLGDHQGRWCCRLPCHVAIPLIGDLLVSVFQTSLGRQARFCLLQFPAESNLDGWVLPFQGYCADPEPRQLAFFSTSTPHIGKGSSSFLYRSCCSSMPFPWTGVSRVRSSFQRFAYHDC